MDRRRVWVATILLLFLLVAWAPPGVTATTECAQTLSSVPVGTGQHLVDVAALNGFNHVDVAIPSCSEGRFSFGPGTASGIGVQKFCVDGFVRVYAAAGTFDNDFLINWLPNDGKGCAATLDEGTVLPQLP